MRLEKKSFALTEVSTTDDGIFEGYASVFGNVDSCNDIVEHGAFKRTLDHWQRKGRPVPVLWQHEQDTPIGFTVAIAEDSQGLRVKGKLILEVQKAREAHALLKADVLGGMSIGYKTIKEQYKSGVRHLRELALGEYSLVTIPANELAVVTSVKSAFNVDVDESLEQTLERVEEVKSVQLYETLVSETLTQEQKSEAVDAVLETYNYQMLRLTTRALHENKTDVLVDALKTAIPYQAKAGKVLSASSRGKISAALQTLKDLLDSAEATPDEPKSSNTENSAQQTLSQLAKFEPSSDMQSLKNLSAMLLVKAAQVPSL